MMMMMYGFSCSNWTFDHSVTPINRGKNTTGPDDAGPLQNRREKRHTGPDKARQPQNRGKNATLAQTRTDCPE